MDYLLCGNLPYPAWKKRVSVQNLSNRRIRRYLVCRLKRPEARDFSHVRFTDSESYDYGYQTVIIAGDRYEYGSDEDEIIVENAEVIGIV